ncbi:MAG: xanthine dehydrogenase family protein [Armatimonadetes bacterium]|nr:xanthine dehydrogenase family protein [Armatimonadota bacterium]
MTGGALVSGAYVGTPHRQLSHERLLRGRGRFLNDIQVPGLLHVAFVRSPHAAARLVGVDATAALRVPGVVAAIDYATLAPFLKAPIPVIRPHPDMKAITAPPLADRVVRYVGEPVAAVVADTPYAAEDALEAVAVTYEPLPAVADVEEALRPGAPLLHPQFGTNVALRFHMQCGDAARAFREAPIVREETFRLSRGSAQSMETRGVVAWHDPQDGLLVWSSTQHPFNLRRALVQILGLPEGLVHVVAPDVGGGFGAKLMYYAEEFVLPVLALRLQRPVKWVEDRRESFMATSHQAEQVHHARIAARADGTVLAFEDSFLHAAGAYTPYGSGSVFNTATTLPGPYRIPHCSIEGAVVYTHCVPTTPYRGSGRPQACFVINRMVDRVAQAAGVDPVEVRRRNLIRPEEFPYDNGLSSRSGAPVRYDTGDYPAALERLVGLAGYAGLRTMQEEARRQGRHLGVGLACYVENTAQGSYESARVSVDALGEVLVATGAASQGQGHETVLAQIAADVLGVRPENIRVVGGDTRAIPYGVGTFGSRTAVTAGNAVLAAAQEVRQKALRLAAHLLETTPADLVCRDSHLFVRGAPSRSLTLAQVARAADPMRNNPPTALDPGLAATAYHQRTEPTYGAGAHASLVEVDPSTGRVQVLGYWVVHDCGVVLNPAIVEGQVVGGVAQGIGGALYERIHYDAGGQLLTATFMDFLLPTAAEVPPVVAEHSPADLPDNPLGVKGVGEAGIIPAPAVIVAAVEDALRPFGAALRCVPVDPQQVLNAVAAARPSTMAAGARIPLATGGDA